MEPLFVIGEPRWKQMFLLFKKWERRAELQYILFHLPKSLTKCLLKKNPWLNVFLLIQHFYFRAYTLEWGLGRDPALDVVHSLAFPARQACLTGQEGIRWNLIQIDLGVMQYLRGKAVFWETTNDFSYFLLHYLLSLHCLPGNYEKDTEPESHVDNWSKHS